MFIHDGATALSRARTPEGFLRVRARIGRSGLHDYKAGEIGGPPGAPPEQTIRVYRPPDDVFDPRSLASFAEKPVTLDHPPRMVDAANWKGVAVGHSGPAVTREGDHVAADLTITDAAAVARAEAGAQLSNGYWADFVFEPGVTPEGEAYDALQRNIRGNHIALVDAGRCGPTCRIGAADAASDACTCGGSHSARDERHSVTIEGRTVVTDAAGVATLTTLQAVLDAARASERHPVPDVAMLDALVIERLRVLDGARQILGPAFEGAGRPTAMLRRLAVERMIGAEQTRRQGEDYVTAAFDALVAAHHSANPLAIRMAVGVADAPAREAAIAARNLYLSDAWKGEPNPGAL